MRFSYGVGVVLLLCGWGLWRYAMHLRRVSRWIDETLDEIREDVS